MRLLGIIILFLLCIFLQAHCIEIDKITEFAISQTYWTEDSIIIHENYLYTLSSYGLEIYEIVTNGGLQLLSRYPITAASFFIIKDDFAYLTTGELTYCNLSGKLIQINTLDKANPFIEQTLDYDFTPLKLSYYGNHLYLCGVIDSSYTNYFYTMPDLILVSQISGEVLLSDKIDETKALRGLGYNAFEIYDVSNPISMNIIGGGDISQIHLYNIHRACTYCDTILIFSGSSLISLWDVSDLNDWELISSYQAANSLFNYYLPQIINNKILLVEFGYVELLDISDPSQPTQIAILETTPNSTITASCAIDDENIYIATNDNGVTRLKISNNAITFEEEIADYYRHSWVENKDNYLISGSYFQGCRYFDVTNPTDPIYMGQLLTSEYNYYFQIDHDLLAVQRIDNYDFVIFNATEIENLTVRSIIHFDNYVLQAFDETDNSAIYFVDQFNYRMLKYDISESGNAVLLFEEQLPFYPYWQGFLIHDGYGYFLQDTGYQKNLYIYRDLDTNNPFLSNTIHGVVTLPFAYISLIEGYLSIFTPYLLNNSADYNTVFFNIADPITPIPSFELNSFGKPYFHNNLIFTSAQFSCSIFYCGINPSGILEPIYSFYDIGPISNISFINYNNYDFLFLNQYSHFSVFEYSTLSNHDYINKPLIHLTNHPNPFNPSTEIRFQMSEVSESAEVVIYNIKGQKVKILDCSNSFAANTRDSCSYYSLIWDGTDQNNLRVSTGVYLYQLQVEGKPVASRKMMMLK